VLYKSLTEDGILLTIKKVINLKRQEKFYKYFYNPNTQKKAIRLGEKIVKEFPDSELSYQLLARAYWNIKDDGSATLTLRKGIKKKFNLNLDNVISEIEKSVSLPSKNLISHHYSYIGGIQNFGMIEHNYRDKILLTKIVRKDLAYGDYIIRDLQKDKKILKSITPEILSILTVGDLSFITMEKIYGKRPDYTDKSIFEKVLDINHVITSVKHSELSSLLTPNTETMELTSDFGLFKALYSINPKNIEVFLNFSNYLKDKNLSLELTKVINHVNEILIVKEYYKFLNPEIHFSLQHGDLSISNLMLNDNTGELKVIDWGFSKLGPKWVDIAIFLAKTKSPFSEILQKFLGHNKCDYDLIEKIFFTYTLIITWIAIFEKGEHEYCFKDFCSPALNYIETLIYKFNEEMFQCS
jgi:serine/threonine protein kinase